MAPGGTFVAPGARWVEGLVPASPAYSFHPNGRGQQAIARQVLAALGRSEDRGFLVRRIAAGPAGVMFGSCDHPAWTGREPKSALAPPIRTC
jgi:hypothetical protein